MGTANPATTLAIRAEHPTLLVTSDTGASKALNLGFSAVACATTDRYLGCIPNCELSFGGAEHQPRHLVAGDTDACPPTDTPSRRYVDGRGLRRLIGSLWSADSTRVNVSNLPGNALAEKGLDKFQIRPEIPTAEESMPMAFDFIRVLGWSIASKTRSYL